MQLGVLTVAIKLRINPSAPISAPLTLADTLKTGLENGAFRLLKHL
jgi:hypothetical protein